MNDAGRIGFLIRGEYSDLETYDFLDIVYYNESSYVAKKTSTGNPPHRNNEFWQIFATGGGSATGGVTNYSELENLPKINNVTLNGNKSLEDLGVPTKTSGLVNDSGFKTTDTWKQNTANSEGYVEKGTGHANQVWKTDANGVPGWRPDVNTTYGDVTASAHGLMTASDKTKLDGIAAGANKTTLTKSLAVTEEGVSALDGTVGKILDSKISTLNDNLMFPDGLKFYPDLQDGKRGFNTDPARGADTFVPFNSGELIFFQSAKGTFKNLTLNFENPYKKEVIACFGCSQSNRSQFFMYDFIHAKGHSIRSISKTDTSITLVRTNDSTSTALYEAWIVLG